MEKRVYAVRGAIFAENTKESIQKKTARLFNEVCRRNQFSADDIVSVQFTLTRDLDAMNPATALRLEETLLDVSAAPLFCSEEAFVQGGRSGVIRLLLTAYLGERPNNVYLDGAEALRPDFSK